MTAQPTAPPQAPQTRLLLRYEAIVTSTVVEHIDVIREFNSLTDADRRHYWLLSEPDFTDAGCEHEWERPLVWLLEKDAMGWATVSGYDSDVDDESFRVAHGSSVPAGLWTRDAYLALCAMVPWLRARDEVDDDEIARMPGPLDVPLELGPR